MAYSISRQESHFSQRSCRLPAMGLMQVTPAAAIDTAKTYKATYNRDQLLKDPISGMQMGAAELSGPGVVITALTSSPLPATMPDAAVCGSGSLPMAIRVIPRLIRSIQRSSASQSPKGVITSSGSWRNCRSIVLALATAAS